MEDHVMEDIFPVRVLPTVDRQNRRFWTSGEEGRLCIERCTDCGAWIHPPTGICSSCHSSPVEPTVVSGRGTIYSFTVNHQPWFGDIGPYCVVLVDLEEGSAAQPLRITSNLVGTDPDDVAIGMPVEVFFVRCDDVWLPQFREIR